MYRIRILCHALLHPEMKQEISQASYCSIRKSEDTSGGLALAVQDRLTRAACGVVVDSLKDT